MLSGLSLSGIVDFFKNLNWETVNNFIHTVSTQLRGYLEEYLGPYKKFLQENKVMLIYGAIAIGILLFPILLFLLFVLVVVAIGFVIYCILVGLVIAVGFVVLVVVLIPIVILLVLVGLIVFLVDWIIKKVQKSDEEESTAPVEGSEPQGQDNNANDEVHLKKQ